VCCGTVFQEEAEREVPAVHLAPARAQQDPHRADRGRDRSRGVAGLPAAHDAGGARRTAQRRRIEHPHRRPQRSRLAYPLPYAYLQKIRAQQGVVSAASWTWYGGVFREEKGVEFPNFAVEPDPLGSVWADWNLDPQQLEAFRRHRDGAIVGRGTLLKNGWKIGDRVTLKGTIYPVDLSFRSSVRSRASERPTSGSSASTSTRRCAPPAAAASTSSAPSGCASTIPRASRR
jgi:hypothetical protein